MKIIADLPFEDYLAHHALGSHDLGYLADCPAVFKYHQENKQSHESVEAKPDLIEGRALHLATFQRDLFESTVIKIDTKTTAKENGNIIELGWERYDRVVAMSKAIWMHDDVRRLLSKGIAEASVFTTLDGVEVKSRPDFLPWLPIIVDLKGTRNRPSLRNFKNDMYRYRYHVQGAFYRAQQPEKLAFVFIYAPKIKPYLPVLYELDDTAFEIGTRDWQRQLETYKQCTETGKWPGYEGIRIAGLPHCALMEEGYGNL